MTLQDYTKLSQDSLNVLFTNLGPVVANIVAAVVTIAIGVLIGWILKRLVEEVSRVINFERAAANWSWYSKVVKAHEEADLTTFLGEVVRWVAIGVFLIPALASLQIEGAEAVFSLIFDYISTVLVATLYLLFGFVLAWFIKRLVLAAGVIFGNNPAHLIASTAYYAIVIFASIQAILALGVTTDLIRLFVLAGFAAFAIAFGLGGRDTASDWLKRLMEKTKS